jgi:hypothetical protein
LLISQKIDKKIMIQELKYSKDNNRILILGALGQIGSVLTKELRKIHGHPM